ncbi:MAG: hypothetical protein ACE5FB_00460 [Candidatus Binatia bacterium]
MLRRNLVLSSALFLTGCSPALTKLGIVSRSGNGSSPVYTFALAEEEVKRMKEETFEKELYRPHPSREREMIANLPKEPGREGDDQAPKRFVSEEGFPLITFRGGPMPLGEALEFIAGSAGYRVEWEEGTNRALPVATTFTETPLHKAVAALLKPFGYFAVVDSQKGMMKISLKPEVEVEETGSPSRYHGGGEERPSQRTDDSQGE